MSTLTASEVRSILACAGGDWSGLGIRDEAAGVVVSGPAERRKAAFHVLFWDKGLRFASYPDRDIWVRQDSSEEGEDRGT